MRKGKRSAPDLSARRYLISVDNRLIGRMYALLVLKQSTLERDAWIRNGKQMQLPYI